MFRSFWTHQWQLHPLQIEAEEREKRLGPGGLDPQEVYEELPAVSITCKLFLAYNYQIVILLIFKIPNIYDQSSSKLVLII